jgi:hypothetical protein
MAALSLSPPFPRRPTLGRFPESLECRSVSILRIRQQEIDWLVAQLNRWVGRLRSRSAGDRGGTTGLVLRWCCGPPPPCRPSLPLPPSPSVARALLLDLSGKRVGDDGGALLARGLQPNTSLVSLTLQVSAPGVMKCCTQKGTCSVQHPRHLNRRGCLDPGALLPTVHGRGGSLRGCLCACVGRHASCRRCR